MKKTVNIILILVIILGMLTITVKGASFKFTPTPSSTEVEAGETITIALRLSDINAGELGISTFKSTFKYDETVFEDVQVSATNNWSIRYNNLSDSSHYGTLLAALLSAGVTEDQEIGIITLKVKSDSQGKTGNITFTEVSTNDGEQIIYDTDKTITVKVLGEGNQNAGTDNTDNTGNIGNTDNTNTQNNNPTNANEQTNDGTVSQSKLPHTGLILNTIIIVCALLVILFSTIGYIQYRKTK